ncbi:tRNA lysidine(34) synthetase TilS [Desulfopila aestuarii]|uniref:tRNA(Ile)-lysidine synthase n=1 Tax=Desulfopila aestuarii DSM 18488 TaxID=1121416 RepID=A0A1M7Y3R4_9BACT|nr:tRNA lysidine(34) synthetase TilS [Desulfopila aestuarii]SHO46852.1 tRNA(Ile)-lysidine synthase [Desulfopila aestuarii DSM 18488]
MHDLVHKIVRNIHTHQLLQRGDKVIIATSGGVDSTALLHILASSELDLNITAVYVDHGLRPEEANNEKHFTLDIARKLGVSHRSVAVDVYGLQKKQSFSLEEAARILRYRALEKIRDELKAEEIAVAHTAGDQVEEFLIRMIRGSGLKGLSGMRYRQGHIIRPLLDISRDSLLEYLHQHNLDSCHDSSNDDRRFLRNRIRLDLLPELEARYNPAIRTNILQTTAILAQEEAFLEDIARDHLNNLCTIIAATTPGELPTSISCQRVPFHDLHPAMQRRMIESICWKMGSRPSFRQILQMVKLVATGRPGSKFHLQSGLRLLLDGETAHFSHPQGRKPIRGEKPGPQQFEKVIATTGIYEFRELHYELDVKRIARKNLSHDLDDQPEGTIAVDADLAHFPLLARPPLPGETMCPLGAPGKKKIARIFSDLKIPADSRQHYPLVLKDNEPAAILGLKIADRYKITDETTAVLLLTWKRIETKTE